MMGRKASTIMQLISSDLERGRSAIRKYMLASSLPEHEKAKHEPNRKTFPRDRTLFRLINRHMRCHAQRR